MSCDPESSSGSAAKCSGGEPQGEARYRLTPAAPPYTLTIAECVTAITKGEFAADAGSVKLDLRLAGKLGGSPNRAITSILLPSTLTKIGDYAFYNHNSVSSTLVIPKTVRTIGKQAFRQLGIGNSPSFLNVVFQENSELKTIGQAAFGNARLKIRLPEKLETIGEQAFAFANVEARSSFTIPANVKNIGQGAFLKMDFLNDTLRIESPDVILGNLLFVLDPTENPLATVQLPKTLYERYTVTERTSRFGQVTAYQDLDGKSH